jgi:hypothetical protein
MSRINYEDESTLDGVIMVKENIKPNTILQRNHNAWSPCGRTVRSTGLERALSISYLAHGSLENSATYRGLYASEHQKGIAGIATAKCSRSDSPRGPRRRGCLGSEPFPRPHPRRSYAFLSSAPPVGSAAEAAKALGATLPWLQRRRPRLVRSTPRLRPPSRRLTRPSLSRFFSSSSSFVLSTQMCSASFVMCRVYIVFWLGIVCS